MTETETQIRRKRLLYQAQHRGFKEADLIIGHFAAEALAGMSDMELDEFERLLAFSDHDLYAWITGDAEPPANVYGPVFTRLCAFDIAKITAPRD